MYCNTQLNGAAPVGPSRTAERNARYTEREERRHPCGGTSAQRLACSSWVVGTRAGLVARGAAGRGRTAAREIRAADPDAVPACSCAGPRPLDINVVKTSSCRTRACLVSRAGDGHDATSGDSTETSVPSAPPYSCRARGAGAEPPHVVWCPPAHETRLSRGGTVCGRVCVSCAPQRGRRRFCGTACWEVGERSSS